MTDPLEQTPSPPEHPGRRRLLLGGLGLGLAPVWVACGGGGVEGQGTGTTPGFAQGAISGFGSVIVNGIRFDDSTATVRDDEGRSLSRDDLRLGMVVAIDSNSIDRSAGTAVANTITVGAELRGPVAANELAAGTLTVLGQTVDLTVNTALDAAWPGGQSAIPVGAVVSVYALFDAGSLRYLARRVEPEASASSYRIRGVVQGLNTAAQTFQMGSAVFSYAGATLPAGVANGQVLKLSLRTTPDGLGRWVVSSFASADQRPAEGTEVELEGLVSSYTSLSSFVVSGWTVNAAGARVEPAGATVAAGVRVEVEGLLQGGVLVASSLEIKSAEDGGDDDEEEEIELKGRITAIDTSAKTLVLREVSVSYASGVTYQGGTEAQLAVGVTIEVKGVLSADGTAVVAQTIEFDD